MTDLQYNRTRIEKQYLPQLKKEAEMWEQRFKKAENENDELYAEYKAEKVTREIEYLNWLLETRFNGRQYVIDTLSQKFKVK
jgi:hypothetical protein